MNIDTNTNTNGVAVLKAHLAINVRNVTNSIEFYKKMLGIEPSKVRIGYAKFDVRNPPLNLTLNQVPFNEQGALSHLGLQVASSEDVFAIKAGWERRGLLPREELQTDCCYALQDKAWVNDPDGNEWEVFTVIEDNLAETSERTVSCCVPEPASIGPEGVEALSASCDCESARPAEAEAAWGFAQESRKNRLFFVHARLLHQNCVRGSADATSDHTRSFAIGVPPQPTWSFRLARFRARTGFRA